ncbi:Na+/H+ antiporter subunit E [Spiribacter onubensis]|uniref:Na+/H+ antiporter subunit E n=1 Tax=Spiribacter onubensis TaxID=3122420 RepID=A0ABV3S616_9GAMM
MRYFVSLTVVLAVLWLGLSGVYKPLLFGLGAASIVLVVWLTERMEVLGAEHDPATLSWRLPVYWVWLMWQVIKSNIAVARAVLDPRRIEPMLVELPADQRTRVGRVTYGNSITLTPGTVTTRFETDGDGIQIHALLPEAAEDLRRGEMARRVRWLEGDG